jgi:hypothetical protein
MFVNDDAGFSRFQWLTRLAMSLAGTGRLMK